MAVSQNEAVRSDNESGPATPDFAWAALTFETLFDIDINDCRADAISRAHDGARVLIEQGRIIPPGRGL